MLIDHADQDQHPTTTSFRRRNLPASTPARVRVVQNSHRLSSR